MKFSLIIVTNFISVNGVSTFKSVDYLHNFGLFFEPLGLPLYRRKGLELPALAKST